MNPIIRWWHKKLGRCPEDSGLLQHADEAAQKSLEDAEQRQPRVDRAADEASTILARNHLRQRVRASLSGGPYEPR